MGKKTNKWDAGEEGMQPMGRLFPGNDKRVSEGGTGHRTGGEEHDTTRTSLYTSLALE